MSIKSIFTPVIKLSQTGKEWEVWYTKDGKKYYFHKRFKSVELAGKETVSLRGHAKLLKDLKN